MVDLSTTYLGLNLKHPVVPSASPLSDRLDKIRRLEDAGAAAVVMYSLFEEQIVGEGRFSTTISLSAPTASRKRSITSQRWTAITSARMAI